MAIGKTFDLKFYDKTGVFIDHISKFQIGSFRKVINGGLGDLTIILPIPFDQAYVRGMTTLFNRVELFVQGTLLYSGFIATIDTEVEGRQEKVILTCRGHASRFAFIPLKDGTTTTLKTDTAAGLVTAGSASAADLNVIMEAIVDRYNAEAVYPVVNYTASSIEAIATPLTYIFNSKTILAAIEKSMEIAAAGTYWRVGADNVFYLATKNPGPDITLNFATQVSTMRQSQTIDGLTNRLLVAYNGSPPATVKLTSDTDSSDAYGDWWQFKTDGRYTVAGNVTSMSNAIIASKKNPQRTVILEVPDSAGSRTKGYDIETIEPGQTLKLVNLPDAASQTFPSLFQIVAVTYTPTMATLELETPLIDLAREAAKMERLDQAAETDNNPSTYS